MIPLLIGGTSIGLHWFGIWQLKRMERRLAAQGVLVSRYASPRPSPPDEENFCATPLLRDVARNTATGHVWQRVESIRRWHNSLGPDFRFHSPDHPTPTDWRGLYDELRKSHPDIVRPEGDGDPVAALWTWLEDELEPVTAELRPVLGRPRAVFVPSYLESAAHHRFPANVGPSIKAIAGLNSAYSHRASLAVAREDGASLIESVHVLLSLAQACHTETGQWQLYWGQGVLFSAQQASWSAGNRRFLSRSEWIRLSELWRSTRPLEVVDAMVATMMVDAYANHGQLKEDPVGYLRSMGWDGTGSWRTHVAEMTPAGWFDAAFACQLSEFQLLRQRLADASLPDRFEIVDWVTLRVGDARFPSPRIGIRPLREHQYRIRDLASNEAVSRCAEAACALEAYYVDHKEYPVALTALVPTLLPNVPLDLDGQPIRYAADPSNGRYRLWSVGLNGVDDGGVVRTRIGRRARVWHESIDWVWQYAP